MAVFPYHSVSFSIIYTTVVASAFIAFAFGSGKYYFKNCTWGSSPGSLRVVMEGQAAKVNGSVQLQANL